MTGKLICPAGKSMKLKSRNFVSSDGLKGTSYMGQKQNCMTCKLRDKCLRKKTTEFRQVILFDKVENFSTKMRNKFDTPYARSLYSKRMGTVEPVFGHLRATKKLDRFTLRTKKKVNNQWLLYCMVHNIGKISRYGNY